MSRTLRVGDRVRVTDRDLIYGYQPGDKGTVVRITASADGRRRYLVAMDKGQLDATGMLFTDGEIEAADDA
jgi:hypothetical protein